MLGAVVKLLLFALIVNSNFWAILKRRRGRVLDRIIPICPKKINSLRFWLEDGYHFGRRNNCISPIRMKHWPFASDVKNEAYTLKDYEYIVGGSFDEKCNFHYTVYIRDRYDFNFIKDKDGSYFNFDNFARLMAGVIPGAIAQARSFLVKSKKEGVIYSEDFEQ